MICPCKCLAICNLFSFAPLVVGGRGWVAKCGRPASFLFFFFIHSKAKRNFERNPVINISKWFIYSIFTLCSSRDTFYERSEMVFTRHLYIYRTRFVYGARKSMKLTLYRTKKANWLCELTQSTLYWEDCRYVCMGYYAYLVWNMLLYTHNVWYAIYSIKLVTRNWTNLDGVSSILQS